MSPLLSIHKQDAIPFLFTQSFFPAYCKQHFHSTGHSKELLYAQGISQCYLFIVLPPITEKFRLHLHASMPATVVHVSHSKQILFLQNKEEEKLVRFLMTFACRSPYFTDNAVHPSISTLPLPTMNNKEKMNNIFLIISSSNRLRIYF